MINRKFASSAAAVFAASMLAVASSTAMAAVVCASPNLDVPSDISGVYLNLVTGDTSGGAGWDINPYNNNAGLTFYGAASPSGILATGSPGVTAETVVLASGDAVSPTPAPNFYNQFQTRGTSFQTAGTRFLGVKFMNEGTATMNYGWVEMISGAAAGFPATIARYCYDDTGAAITAGTTPVSLQSYSID